LNPCLNYTREEIFRVCLGALGAMTLVLAPDQYFSFARLGEGLFDYLYRPDMAGDSRGLLQ